ncbi:hypothetical protein MKW98_031228 [Papaver atlanticum]|uniref:Uncharacterized protein n=1 Tax=Papaver atlanticum TaxID=357466 RepID=A0AAD4XFT1_9MAGN|nr:hypothetical protein MKW98_031228 [Papaver atlanticum]
MRLILIRSKKKSHRDQANRKQGNWEHSQSGILTAGNRRSFPKDVGVFLFYKQSKSRQLNIFLYTSNLNQVKVYRWFCCLRILEPKERIGSLIASVKLMWY